MRLFTPELSTNAVREAIAKGLNTVLLTLGSTEQHGPALPLTVDNHHGVATCLRAASLDGRALVGPAIPFGWAPQHLGFPGTVSIREDTLAALIRDLAESHARSGFRLVYFWIAHAENFPTLERTLPELRHAFQPAVVDGLRDLSGYLGATWGMMGSEEGVEGAVAGSHAGEIETSMMLAIDPSLVAMDQAEAGNARPFEEIAPRMMIEGMAAVSPNGVLGDQRAGDPVRGTRYLDRLAAWLAADLTRARKEAGLD